MHRCSLLHVGNRRIEIELTDVTENETSDAGILGNTPYFCRRSMERRGCTSSDGKVHDQHVRPLREVDELAIGSVLVG
jgi:hypothetical protein